MDDGDKNGCGLLGLLGLLYLNNELMDRANLLHAHTWPGKLNVNLIILGGQKWVKPYRTWLIEQIVWTVFASW